MNLLVFLFLVLSPRTLHAVDCEVKSKSIPKTTWETLRVTTGKKKTLVLVRSAQIPLAAQKTITSLLKDESKNFHSIAQAAEALLAANQESLVNHAELVIYVHHSLLKRELNYVITDHPPENIPKWENLARELYLNAFYMQVHEAPGDVSLDRLILLTVGVPFYLYAVEPELFKDVALEGLAKISPPIAAANENPSPEDADQAFEKLKTQLRHSRRSLRQAERLRAQIHSRRYAKLSREELRRQVLGRFWRRAQPAVREWLDAELNARGGSPKTSGKKPKTNFAESMLMREGKGIAFLYDEKFDRLKKEFDELCD